MRFAVVVALAVAAGGCADGPFKRAVSAWAGSHMKPYARYVITDSAYASDADRSRELMTVAGVQCLVDEDKQESTPERKSPACKCARPTSPELRVANCQAWASGIGATPKEK